MLMTLINLGDEFPNVPIHVPGKQKYCGFRPNGKGLYSAASFNRSLPLHFVEVLVASANNSLSSGTWSQYRSTRKHLEACQARTGVRMTFPMDENQILNLVGYLFDRGLKGKSVGKVLSSLRTLHMVEGVPSPCLRTQLVSAVIHGKENFDEEEQRSFPKRQPVTIKVLQLLQITLRLDKTRSDGYKKLIFAVACIAFNGALR